MQWVAVTPATAGAIPAATVAERDRMLWLSEVCLMHDLISDEYWETLEDVNMVMTLEEIRAMSSEMEALISDDGIVLEEPEKPSGDEPRVGRIPREPTQKERDAHEATHLPHEEWCEFCMAGRGRNRPHRKKRHDTGQEDPE